MTQAGAADDAADVRARVSGEAEAAQAAYTAAMLPVARRPRSERIASAVRLASGWVCIRGFAGPEINAPRYVGAAPKA